MNEKQTQLPDEGRLFTANQRGIWAMLPEAFRHLLLAGAPKEIDGAAIQAARAGVARGSSIAVLPLYGPILQRDAEFWGGTSTERFTATFRTLLADDSTKAIVLDVDSPGGSVYGVDELSKEIFQARGVKPVIAVVNSLAASAAYWVASAAQEMVITPGGEAGSIGVFVAHADWSEAFKSAGVAISLIHAGQYKIEGNPYQPLGEEARAQLQKEVDGYYSMFTAAVARNRGVTVAAVGRDFGQGRVFQAKEAKDIGLVDRVGTLSQTLAKFGVSQRASGTAAQCGVEILRREVELLELNRR